MRQVQADSWRRVPRRAHHEDFDVLREALKEVAKEDPECRKAEEMIRKALDLKRQMDDAERQFTSQKKKWDKELGKTLQRLNNMAQNKPLDEGIQNDDKEKELSEETN